MNTKAVLPLIGVLLLGVIIGVVISRLYPGVEPFVNVTQSNCTICRQPPAECCSSSCNGCSGSGAGGTGGDRTACPQINWSKYVLKASIPPCPPLPDMSRYMLKTECPAPPDMSKYILKSAVPACPPCISTCNKPCKIGECPPCPRPRCPVVTCPEPRACPPCAPVEPPRCPDPKVTCKADFPPEEPWTVRPLLASISPM